MRIIQKLLEWLRIRKSRLKAVGIRFAYHAISLYPKIWHYLCRKRRPIGRYGSLSVFYFYSSRTNRLLSFNATRAQGPEAVMFHNTPYIPSFVKIGSGIGELTGGYAQAKNNDGPIFVRPVAIFDGACNARTVQDSQGRVPT